MFIDSLTRSVKEVEAFSTRPDISAGIDRFVTLFLAWNSKINLSAARTREQVEAHVADSLHVVTHLRGTADVLDVGAGGGLPGVLIALVLPETQVLSLEPTHKKHAFLRTAGRELGLINFDAQAKRLEDHPRRDHAAAVSRATFDLATWLDMGSAVVKPGGVVVGMEAMDRIDLGPLDTRHSYEFESKRRAIVVRRVPE